MSLLAMLAVLSGVSDSLDWRSHTNTNFVNAIVGSDSLVFLATNGGLVELQIWPERRTLRTLTNTDGLPSNRCLCIAEDPDGNLWVGTDDGGLAVVASDHSGLREYRPTELARHIRSIAFDGTRLLCATDQGLYCVETQGTWLGFDDDVVRRLSVARYPDLLSDRLLSLAVGDGYWIGSNRGLSYVDRDFSRWGAWRAPLGDSVRAVAFYRDSIMVATEDGLALKEGAVFRQVYAFPRATEVFALVTSGPAIYLATKTGLHTADSAAQQNFQIVLGEDCRSVRAGGALWVGCGGDERSGAGLRYLLSGQTWGSYYNECIGSDAISDCAIGSNGDVYLCHASWQYSHVTPEGVYRVAGTPLPLPYQVRVDSDGRLWFGHFASNGGVSSYDPATGQWTVLRWGDFSSWNIIDALGIDMFDTKWVYNGGNVVVAIDSMGRQNVFSIPGVSPPAGGLYEFAFSWSGKAWLGLTVGLVLVDHRNTLHDPSDDEYRVFSAGLPAPEVRTLAVDSRDRVWVGTSQGAAVWNGERFEVFTRENTGGGLPANNVYRIRCDASDRVWFLCDAGLAVYDPVTGQWQDLGAGGLISNPSGAVGFYSALDVSSHAGVVAVGTQRGLSVRRFGDDAPQSADAMLVYPNPCVLDAANPERRVVVSRLPEGVANVWVYTLSGRSVTKLWVDRAMHRAVWNPQGMATGIYLLVAVGPSGARTTRVSIVRR